MTSKERCLAVIKGLKSDRVPVFPLLMFFAADRAKLSYKQFATDGAQLAEAQLMMYDRFNIDAVTACSDAYRISADLAPDKMAYPDNSPPYLSSAIVTCSEDIKKLSKPDPADARGRMHDRAKALEIMSKAIGNECLVTGWIEMPFAEACCICGVSDFMIMLYENPKLAHQVLEFTTQLNIDFALYQIAHGADMIGAGDAAASLVSAEMYAEFVLPYQQRICSAVHDAHALVKLHICGDTTKVLGQMVKSAADLFNVDHLVNFDTARDVYTGADKCYKGNLDPVADIMQACAEDCQLKAKKCIESAKGTRFMLSAGCEIPAATTDENMQVFCDAGL
jgi:MtaA/CmuA family methyltransferase